MARFAFTALAAVLLSQTFPGALCQTVTTAYPLPPAVSCLSVKPCTTDLRPVCGSNGVTYDNQCDLEIATCQSNGKITKVADDACTGGPDPFPPAVSCLSIKPCTKDLRPVCGSNGVTYNNQCDLEIATCQSNGKITKVADDACTGGPDPFPPAVSCLSIKPCTADLRPVCGSNGVTYDNQCDLEIATCQSNGKITKVADYACTGGPDPFPPAVSCLSIKPCTTDLRPVCGSNGVTYNNQCDLEIATCQSNGKITKVADDACTGGPDPFPTAVSCLSIKPCTTDLRPVCGSNGVTYDNQCYLEIATCQSNGKITKVADDACTGGPDPFPPVVSCLSIKPCTNDIKPVCGSDGKTYNNICLFEIADCQAGGALTVVSNSPCTSGPGPCGKPCTKDIRPVCGSDGKTYDNFCLFEIADCQAGGALTVVSNSPCTSGPGPCGKPCTKDVRPVCGSDGKTYDNVCLFEIADCQAGGALTVVSNSPCTSGPGPCGKPCTKDVRPVCGSDGKTYDNVCLFEIADCQAGGALTVVSNSPCTSGPGPCGKPCTTNLRPVCGSNGVTYDNQCLLEIAVCQSGGSFTKVSDGECGTSGGSYVRCRNAGNCATALGGAAQDWVCVSPTYCRPMTCKMVDWRPTLCGPRTCQFSNRAPIRFGYCRPRSNSYK